MPENKIRILVVDDSSFMRNILSRMIMKDDRFEVIAKAKDGEEGVKLAAELNPDVVTMDIEMPVMTGVEALEKIMKDDPRPVVMVSSLTEEGAQSTMECLEKGAVDFIPKALESKDKNIFSVSNILHDKLAAAAKAKLGLSRRSVVKNSDSKLSGATKTAAVSISDGNVDAEIVTKPKANKFNKARILLIGSSTGGPRALQSLVPLLPKNLNMPVVIAQHMPPNFTTAMADRLDSNSELKVVEAKDGDSLENGCVYISPGGLHTRVVSSGSGHKLEIREDTGKESVYKPSVDILSESVNNTFGGNVLAVMLTGMGADGSKEFDKLQQSGAYIIAQDKDTCVVYGMPRCVVEKGIANEVLPLEDIAPTIKKLLS